MQQEEPPAADRCRRVGDSLDAATAAKFDAARTWHGSSKARRAGLIAAGGAVGLTAGSAGISSLRRRSEGRVDAS